MRHGTQLPRVRELTWPLPRFGRASRPGGLGDTCLGFGWAGFGWAGFGWAGFGWAGFGWAGFGWAGFGWAVLNTSGALGLIFGLGWAGLGWAGFNANTSTAGAGTVGLGLVDHRRGSDVEISGARVSDGHGRRNLPSSTHQ
jgi:hypothetical protein